MTHPVLAQPDPSVVVDVAIMDLKTSADALADSIFDPDAVDAMLTRQSEIMEAFQRLGNVLLLLGCVSTVETDQ